MRIARLTRGRGAGRACDAWAETLLPAVLKTHGYPKGRKETEPISPNTVVKWSRSLQAACERVNRNAGRRCVRGVVEESKLLSENPWRQFTWVEGVERIRDDAELIRETDEQLRQKSNRTFHRLLASLPLQVRRRYGYVPSPTAELEEELQLAHAAKDWRRVKQLATKLAAMKKAEGRIL